MMVAVRAIYENGNLRLLDPVELKAGQIVVVKIDPDDGTESVIRVLDPANLTSEEEQELLNIAFGDSVRWADPTYDENAWVEDEAENIARELAGGKPLSEIIIEERHEP